MKHFKPLNFCLLLSAAAAAGCYLSTGASFHEDAAADGPADIVSDDGPVDDGAGDHADPIETPPPPCDTPPLLEATKSELIGEASPRVVGAAFYDKGRDRVVIYGGLRGSGDYTSDAVAIDLATDEIKLLGYEGSSPVGWTQAGTAYDPVDDRVFVVGGTVRGSFSRRVLEIQHVGDDALRATNLPDIPDRPLRAVAAGWDPDGRRLVFFGGFDGTGTGHSGETWYIRPEELDYRWRKLPDTGEPVPQEGALMTHVPSFGLVMLAKSSWDYQGDRQVFVMRTGDEIWEEIPLDPTWDPGNRPNIFWDNDACRLMTWGGGCTEGAHSIDLFAVPATVTEITLDIDGLEPRVFLNSTLDTKRRRVIIHGGYDCRVDVFLRPVEQIFFL